jgi:hypothetical protein
MNWKAGALLPILALWACAEGGIRGSGISTVVEGNVASVQPVARLGTPDTASPGLLAGLREFLANEAENVAHAQTGLEGIRVTVEGTRARGLTDANGHFSVHGRFEGPVSVVFEPPGDGGSARLVTSVPGGGTVTLTNVSLDTEQGQAIAETQDVDFDGTISEANCADLTLTMVSVYYTGGDRGRYTLQLDTSSLEDTHGNALTCEDLQGGEHAMVRGMVNPDLTFGNATVEVTDYQASRTRAQHRPRQVRLAERGHARHSDDPHA